MCFSWRTSLSVLILVATLGAAGSARDLSDWFFGATAAPFGSS